MFKKKLPTCSIAYDKWNGDYDCESNHNKECERCLCLYHETGGLYDPETGKKANKFIAFLFYEARKNR